MGRKEEKELEEKARLIKLQKEEIKELKEKIKKIEVTTEERIILQKKIVDNLEEKIRTNTQVNRIVR